jgi:uncharacterized protein YaiE (UPF0345 family)
MTRAKDISKIVTDADLSGTLDVTGNLTVDTNTLFVDSANNRVGIGTASSLVRDLNINGTAANSKAFVRFSHDGLASTGLDVGYSSAGYASIYNAENTAMVFSTNASEAMRIDSSGNVGIGTSSPSALLHLDGTTPSIYLQPSADTEVAAIRFRNAANSNTQGMIEYNNSENSMSFRTNGVSDRVFIDSSGNVGIGIASPANTVHVYTANNAILRLEETNGYLALQQSGVNSYINNTASGGQLIFRNGASQTERMRIDSSGNVGIGLSSNIDRKLHVEVDNTYAAKFGGTAGGDFAIEIGQTGTNSSAGFNATGTGGAMKFSISGSEAMRIDTSSNLLVGTTSVMTDFGEGRTTVAIKGTGTADYASLQLGNNATTGDTQILGVLAFHDNTARNAQINAQRDGGTNEASLNFFTASAGNLGSAKMTIKSDGNVGIGTSSPATDLDVAGNILTSSALYLNSLSVGSMAYFSYSGGNSRLWNTVNGALVFGTNNTERMRILPSGGITFNGDTATANALDDYEEGTWTPAIATTTGSITINSSFSGGSYTKIGDTVIAWAKIRPLSQSSPTGGLDITGLPFTAKSGSGTNAGGVGQGIVEGSYSSDPNIVLAQVGTGSTSITLRRRNGATSTNDMATYLVDGNYYTFTVIYKI